MKGIGPKAAQRLILELHDKIGKIGGGSINIPGIISSAFDEALQAMQALGFVRATAEKALLRVSKEQGENATTESLVKDAFKYL